MGQVRHRDVDAVRLTEEVRDFCPDLAAANVRGAFAAPHQ
jgi:hypothetical protein